MSNQRTPPRNGRFKSASPVGIKQPFSGPTTASVLRTFDNPQSHLSLRHVIITSVGSHALDNILLIHCHIWWQFTDNLFWFWIHTIGNFHTEMTSSSSCCFHLKLFDLGDAVFSCHLKVLCFACLITISYSIHHNCGAWYFLTCYPPFTPILFFTWPPNFTFSNIFGSAHSLDIINQQNTAFILWL
jgi:hypothetical protein